MAAYKNFSYSTVAVAPSPATTGTSLTVSAGQGALFAIGRIAVIYPTGAAPLSSNAELVLVSNVVGDVLTITREQESTTARTVVVGDQIAQVFTAGELNTLESDIAAAGSVATDAIWDASGDLVQGTGANAAARLPIGTAGQVLTVNTGATAAEWKTVAGTGDVVGPASATDGLPALFDTTTGKLLKNSKVTLTQPATASTITVADGKTLTASNTITLTATDGSTLAIGTGGTLGTAAYTAANAYATAAQGSTADTALQPAGNGGSLTGITATQVGLGNVTNAAQTLASIVPNTAPAAGEILVGNAGGTAYAKAAMSGHATLASTGALTLADAAVSLAKMANLEQDKFIIRTTASTGVPETATCTAAARGLLDDATVADMRATLDLEPGTDVLAYVAPGTSGNVLTSNGSAWTSAAASGGALHMVIPFSIGASSWSNMPAAATFFLGIATSLKVDLTGFTQVRIGFHIGSTAGYAGSKLIARYSTSFTVTASDPSDIGATEVSAALDGSTNTYAVSSWVNLAAGAKADVWVCIIGTGGDGAIDPQIRWCTLEFK